MLSLKEVQFHNSYFLFILCSILLGKVLNPSFHLESPELIGKNDVFREYYEVSDKGLEYSVKGPAEVKIFSKAAF